MAEGLHAAVRSAPGEQQASVNQRRAPAQFIPATGIKIVPQRMQQRQPLGFLANVHRIAGLGEHIAVPVTGDWRVYGVALEDMHAYFRTAVDNNWTTAESMWKHWHQHYRIKRRMHDRPTTRQGVGSGTRGGRHNQPVRSLSVDKHFIDEQL